MIELRSDTFTLPTEEMLTAITRAPLGDDVWGEDPTVNELERKAAAVMGKERGLLVTSGTQGNVISILSQTSRGDEVIVGDKSHIFNAEVAASAVIGGVQLRPVPNTRHGTLDLPFLLSAIRPEDVHFPRTALICLENTHNPCGGTVLTLAQMAEVREIADNAGLRVHLDGARIFNAAVALRVEPAEIAGFADSVTFCLSKGLSAPIGSVVCGSERFIHAARKYRKMLGGGLRQAGIVAAPGIVALETMVERLNTDHVHARRLGEALAALPGVTVDLGVLESNIVIADVSGTGHSAENLVARLERSQVLAAPVGPNQVRFVTHRGVSSDEISEAINVLQRELSAPEAALTR